MAWDRIRSSYDAVASTYERRFRDELEGKPRDRELLEAFAAAVGDPVVEIGCGPGQIGAFVQAHGRRVVGLDLSPEMAKLAGRRLDAAVVGDMRWLPFATGGLGGLIAFYSVIHVQRADVAAVFTELYRVLRPRPGAPLVSAHEGAGEVQRDEFIDEPVPMVATLFQLDELVGAARLAGLDVTLAERRPPYDNEGSTTRLYVEATASRGNDSRMR